MNKNHLRDNDNPFLDDDEVFLTDDPTNEEAEMCEPTQWTIVSALNWVLDKAHNSRLSKEFWDSCKNSLAFLGKELGLTDIQIVILAILVESGEAMTWRGWGKYLHCTRLSMMVYSEEIEDLVQKGWIYCRTTHEFGSFGKGYALEQGVVTALRHNQRFVPEKISGLDIQEFLDKVEGRLDKTLDNHNMDFADDEEWMLRLCKANAHLPLCHTVLQFENDIHAQALLMLTVYDYAQWADSIDEGLTMSAIDRVFPEEYETSNMRHCLKKGTHVLMKAGVIEHKCEDGVADVDRYTLTRQCKEELLSGYVPSRSKCVQRRSPNRDLKGHERIKEKAMFYNASEQDQIARLASLLSQENLPGIQERLSSEGMRKGFACLFYGAPGTGKTETVLQLARQTGRDIMQIDIAGMRDKYVGESEKNIKAVFARYREICKQSEVMPILFFNEADAIFGKRTTIGGNNPSVEKMDNAMQNILLQEIEDLDGILIATTNLTCNLDDAFERRFLFKVEFHTPDEGVKVKLWSSMLGDDISEEDAHLLAKRYNFSGGQIENIARKRTINYILYGKKASFEEINEFCKHELLDSGKERKPIGF